MGLRRKAVLPLARDCVSGSVDIGRLAHDLGLDRAREPIELKRVDESPVAVAIARPTAHQQVRAVAHRFHSACHNDRGLTGLDSHCSNVDRSHPRQADLVDGHGIDAQRDSSFDSSVAGTRLALASSKHVSHDDRVDLIWCHVSAFQRAGDRFAAEIGPREAAERTVESPDWRSGSVDDDDVVG